MKKIRLTLIFTVCAILTGYTQKAAIKTNLAYDATATVNVGAEFAVSRKLSVDLSGNYNGWDVVEQKSWQHWMIQPEVRYWTHETFNGHFFGVHGIYANYSISRLDLPIFDMKRSCAYDGLAYGAGLSYGYHIYVTPRLNIELTAGVGFLHFEYDKTNPVTKESENGRYARSYFGPTKVGLSIVYIIF
ncbi:MAG: DUF3575 domain-containing protein [Tannerellaceae bacterium]|jgi:hypothetical protein|nr:DUF3575 domain-containing protein [Tannerellaceae bacterium]